MGRFFTKGYRNRRRDSLSYPAQSWTKDDPITNVNPIVRGFQVPLTGAYEFVGPSPAGISLDPDTGVLSGTPTVEEYGETFVVRVTDDEAVEHDAVVQYSTALAPSVSYASPFSWTTGTPVAASMASAGGQVVATVAISGTVPTGLSVHPTTGAISGTPTVIGVGSFVVRAIGPSGLTDDTTVDWTVSAPVVRKPMYSSAGKWGNEY